MPSRLSAVTAVLALCQLQSIAAQSQAAGGGLERLLAAELARFPAKAGVYVKHASSGEEAAVLADEPFNSASVVKIPVMVLAYRLADAGRLDLDERVTLRAEDLRGGSGVLRYHDLGLAPTVRDLILQMVITSDNTATDLMIRRVGGASAVNEWLTAAGYRATRLNQTTYELFRKRYELLSRDYTALTPRDVYALQSNDPSFASSPKTLIDRALEDLRTTTAPDEWIRRSVTDPSFWLGSMTPRETGRLIENILAGTAASKRACDEMLRAMRAQQSGARRMPHFVNVPVAHKTGDIPPVVANDVGVIYARSGAIVAAFFTNDGRGSYGELEDHIGRATRAIVDYFDGAR